MLIADEAMPDPDPRRIRGIASNRDRGFSLRRWNSAIRGDARPLRQQPASPGVIQPSAQSSYGADRG
jgi:hypothetical protein